MKPRAPQPPLVAEINRFRADVRHLDRIRRELDAMGLADTIREPAGRQMLRDMLDQAYGVARKLGNRGNSQEGE